LPEPTVKLKLLIVNTDSIKVSPNVSGLYTYNYIGSVVGEAGDIADSVSIINCYNEGKIEVKGEALRNRCKIGGIVGGGDGTIDLTDCYNKGDIEANGSGLITTAGGIIGYGANIIRNCNNSATLNIRTNTTNAGGIVGEKFVRIENSNNSGNIKISAHLFGDVNIGGIAGLSHSGSVYYCHNTGVVDLGSGYNCVAGGIVGSGGDTIKY
jgi:hypothetical protein